MRQETVTVVARVDDVPRLLSSLREVAEAKLGEGPRRHQPRLFAAPACGVHFARLTWLPGDPSRGFSDWLALESNFDTELQDTAEAEAQHLETLLRAECATFSQVFESCSEFPRAAGSEAFLAFLKARRVRPSAAYQGHICRDLPRIELERRVRELLLDFFAGASATDRPTLYEQAREQLRARAATDPTLRGLDLDAAPPAEPDPATRATRLRHRILPWISKIGPALPLLGQLREIVSWSRSDVEFDLRAREESMSAVERRRMLEIAESEDRGLQNALTHVVPLRSGANRRAALASAHAYLDRMAREYFDGIGQLGGIPSIHFAKWFLIDDGSRLVFFSNYDGSWESYLGDFVDQAALGLNLAWSCTEEYPKTELLAFGGASDEERFKAWARAYQQPTQVFYSAYPELSIAAINNNTSLRQGLLRCPGSGDLAAWFQRVV